MGELAPFITDLAIILGVASIALILCQWLRQPVVIGYLIAGMIIGPYTPPHPLITDTHAVQTVAELGVIFLMFALGIDFSFHKLKRVGVAASMTGTIEVFFMLFVGFLLGKALHWSNMESLFLGATLSISSTTIIIKTLNELKIKGNFAELVFGVLIIEDLLAILLLAALSTIAITSTTDAANELFHAALKLCIVVGSWFIIGYFIIPIIFRKWLNNASNEILTVIAVALCLLLVEGAARLHYSIALGAFIMGSILSQTENSKRIEQLIHPLRDIFAAVFFVAIGMLIEPAQIKEHIGIIALITVFTMITKLIFTALGAWLSGQRVDNALRIGFSMAQIGEFSFIIAALGTALNLVNPAFNSIIVAVSLITSFTTPYFIRLSIPIIQLFKKHAKPLNRSLYNIKNVEQRKNPHYVIPYLKSLFARLILNGILVGVIFMFISEFFLPQMELTLQPNIFFAILFLLYYLPCAPFIWAMLFAFEFKKDNIGKVGYANAALLCVIFSTIELFVLTETYFNKPSEWLFLILILIFSISLHPFMRELYSWLETHLQHNLKEQRIKH